MKKNGFSLVLVAVSGLIFPPFGCLNAAPPPTPTPTPTPAAVSEVMTKALMERDSLPAAIGSLWRFEGPTNLKKGSSRIDTGRINEIATHPTDPRIMYVTGATGGVWKTVDGGITWAARSQGWPIQAATAVAIDPNDPNRVFVGTGDYKRLDHVEPFSVGIMRSLDGGLTWTKFGSTQMREFTVSRIVVDRKSDTNGDYSRTIFAATGRGSRLPGGQIFRSTNGGETWASVGLPDANWDDLELSGKGTLWASATQRHNLDNPVGTRETGLLYKFAHGGDKWTKVNLKVGAFDLDDIASRPDTIQLAWEPGSANVYVAVYENSHARVFFTKDEGTNWSEMTGASNYPVPVGDHSWGHAAFSVTTNRVYVGGAAIFFSELGAGGLSYSEITNGSLPVDFQCVVPDPTNRDAVFVACDQGIYRYFVVSDTVDSSLNSTLGVTQIFRMDVHPRHGGLIAFGTQDLGTAVSFFENGNDVAALAEPANWGRTSHGDGRSAAFRQDLSSKVYLSITNGLVWRYDGSTLVTLQPDSAPNGQAPLLFRNDTLYYADQDFHWLLNPETQNAAMGTAIWSSSRFRTGPSPTPPATTGPSPIPPATIQSLAFCPTDAQVIYAGSQKGELFLSEDRGTTWTEVTNRRGLPSLPIWAISPSSSNCRNTLVAVGYGQEEIRKGNNVFSGGDSLLRKIDVLAATGHWKGVHGNPPSLPHAPLYAIARLPSEPNSKWFVAGDVGVFRTDDGGDHWANATAPLGLPNTLVRDLRVSGDGNTLYAGTFGRGVWSMDVNPPPDHFGVRGIVTQGGRPVSGRQVWASDSGRIKTFLKNTLTSADLINVATAPIAVTQSATISYATVSLIALNAGGVSLVTPSGAELTMTPTGSIPGVGDEFSLTTASAEMLIGKRTAGQWSFKLSGRLLWIRGTIVKLYPSVVSGVVDLHFREGVSDVTGPDGEFTFEYLRRGDHFVSAFETTEGDSNCESSFGGTNCRWLIDLQSNKTNLEFRQSNSN